MVGAALGEAHKGETSGQACSEGREAHQQRRRPCLDRQPVLL